MADQAGLVDTGAELAVGSVLWRLSSALPLAHSSAILLLLAHEEVYMWDEHWGAHSALFMIIYNRSTPFS